MFFLAEDLILVYRGNPLLCGMLMLNLTLAKERAGIALAKHHLSLLCTAYLYNALQKHYLLKEIWPEMEEVMDGHVDSLFFGPHPAIPQDIKKRLCLRMGLSAMQKKLLERMDDTGSYNPVRGIGGDGINKRVYLPRVFP